MDVKSSTVFIVLIGIIVSAKSQNGPNSNSNQNSNGVEQPQPQYQHSNQAVSSPQIASSKRSTFVFPESPNTQQSYNNLNNQPSYSQMPITPVYQGYGRDVSAQSPVPASPFLGLSSNGDFQLSAYFSTIFWYFTGVTVTIAALIYLIRAFFPNLVSNKGLGSIVSNLSSSTPTGKSLDLTKITNMVYESLDTYSKWAAKDVRDSIHHGKMRK